MTSTVWVDDNWVDPLSPGNPQFGDTVTAPAGETAAGATTLIFGVNAFDGQQDTYGMQAAFTADPSGGNVTILPGSYAGSANTDLPFTVNVTTGTASISGNLGGAFTLTKNGNGTLVLTGTNSYQGGTNISHGAILVSSDAALGDPSGTVTVTSPAAIEFTGNVTSSRIFTLNNNSSLQVVSGTLSLDGAEIDGGFLSGPGSIMTIGNVPTTFNGSQSTHSLAINATVSTNFTNFTDGGALELGAGTSAAPAVFSLSAFTVASSGSMTVDGTANVSDFVSNGVVNVDDGVSVTVGTVTSIIGGTITNVGTSGLTFGGGSVTTIQGATATRRRPSARQFRLHRSRLPSMLPSPAAS